MYCINYCKRTVSFGNVKRTGSLAEIGIRNYNIVHAGGEITNNDCSTCLFRTVSNNGAQPKNAVGPGSSGKGNLRLAITTSQTSRIEFSTFDLYPRREAQGDGGCCFTAGGVTYGDRVSSCAYPEEVFHPVVSIIVPVNG